MIFFEVLFVVLVLVCAVFQYASRRFSAERGEITERFQRFQRNFLLVYLIMMEADWLQGPYVYALYMLYGFTKDEIAALFVAGFLSSMIFGTFVGSLADKFGRKLMCNVFGLIYSISCLTKLINNYHVLMIGRILSGIATSLLFSVFESWMIFEHNKFGFSNENLSYTFSLATFGNGIVAIVAGLIASLVASQWGFVAPFMVAVVFLLLGTFIIAVTWPENYGDARIAVQQTFSNALDVLRKDSRVAVLGIVQSLFEAAMYTFVFMWTPALDPHETHQIPFGLIFACFMVCIMIGSSLFTILIHKHRWSTEIVGKLVLAVATASLSVPYVFAEHSAVVFAGFLLFEVCCGVYFPCFGTLRSQYIPEATRAAVTNFFRVPLNLLVVLVLLKLPKNASIFLVCTAWLGLAWLLHSWFCRLAAERGVSSEKQQITPLARSENINQPAPLADTEKSELPTRVGEGN